MLVTEEYSILLFMKLFVLDVESKQLQEIKTEYQYVMDVTWAPDSRHLLAMVKTGEFEGYSTSGLLLVDTVSAEMEIIPILPIHALGGFNWGLSWAPDGEKIAVGYSDGPGNYNLHRIDVSGP